ncbi:hypothetical protein L1987_89214 [Smallanthus sonchifolius]|nr:hypothetical protein L1987_89214 [Smallanthus sonchifolius]
MDAMQTSNKRQLGCPAFPAVIIPESIPSLDPRKFGASAEYHAPLQAHTASMPPRPSSAPTSPKSLPSRTINRLFADSHEKAGGGAIDFWAVTEFVGFQQLAGLS